MDYNHTNLPTGETKHLTESVGGFAFHYAGMPVIASVHHLGGGAKGPISQDNKEGNPHNKGLDTPSQQTAFNHCTSQAWPYANGKEMSEYEMEPVYSHSTAAMGYPWANYGYWQPPVRYLTYSGCYQPLENLSSRGVYYDNQIAIAPPYHSLPESPSLKAGESITYSSYVNCDGKMQRADTMAVARMQYPENIGQYLCSNDGTTTLHYYPGAYGGISHCEKQSFNYPAAPTGVGQGVGVSDSCANALDQKIARCQPSPSSFLKKAIVTSSDHTVTDEYNALKTMTAIYDASGKEVRDISDYGYKCENTEARTPESNQLECTKDSCATALNQNLARCQPSASSFLKRAIVTSSDHTVTDEYNALKTMTAIYDASSKEARDIRDDGYECDNTDAHPVESSHLEYTKDNDRISPDIVHVLPSDLEHNLTLDKIRTFLSKEKTSKRTLLKRLHGAPRKVRIKREEDDVTY